MGIELGKHRLYRLVIHAVQRSQVRMAKVDGVSANGHRPHSHAGKVGTWGIRPIQSRSYECSMFANIRLMTSAVDC